MSDTRLHRHTAQDRGEHLKLLLWECLLADEVLIRDVASLLLAGELRATNVFEKLCALNVRSATSFSEADHLLCLLGGKPEGLKLLLLCSAILRSLCGLDARLLSSLCRLYAAQLSSLNALHTSKFASLSRLNPAGFVNADALHSGHLLSLSLLDTRSFCCLSLLDASLFLDIDALNASQFRCASLLYAGGFGCSDALGASQLCRLRLLTGKFCRAILTEHLSCLLECLLRACGLNASKAIHQVTLGK